jgi:glycosyltransferase involved in cell wall biosynthesis
MPTAILDYDFDALPEVVTGLDAYGAARILVRLDGRPAAWVCVPVEDGCVRGTAIRGALHNAARTKEGCAFWHAVARRRLASPGGLFGDVLDATAPLSLHDGARLPSATVAVCTRDRPEDLLRCLQALLRMPAEGQEILVVDSASRGEDTRLVAGRFAAVRYLRLERPGLNVARNAALEAARGEIVAFIDDDAVADPHWLQAHRRAFGHGLTLASTGLTLPLELETEAQVRFEAYGGFSRGFTPRTFSVQELSPPAAGQAGAGVNLALRRSVLALVGAFDEALDAGTPTQSGGETDLLARILARHYRIEYTPEALNWHRHRQSEAELRRTIYGYGTGVYAFWTRQVVDEGEWSVFSLAGEWLLRDQVPGLLRSWAGHPGAVPWPLPWDELRGCVMGPWSYWQARRQASAARRAGQQPAQVQPGPRRPQPAERA